MLICDTFVKLVHKKSEDAPILLVRQTSDRFGYIKSAYLSRLSNSWEDIGWTMYGNYTWTHIDRQEAESIKVMYELVS